MRLHVREPRRNSPGMRTTVEFDDDSAKAIEACRRRTGRAVSDAVNEHVRRGRSSHAPTAPVRVTGARSLGIRRSHVSNVAEALDLLEGLSAR